MDGLKLPLILTLSRGPCIGPVAGGYLVEAKGWRWVFWIIAIVVSLIRARIRAGEVLKPEHRLRPYLTVSRGLLIPAGLFVYGWTMDLKGHWIVPMVGTAVFGFGLMGVMVS